MKNRDGNEVIFEQIEPNKYNFKVIDKKGNDASYAWGCSQNDNGEIYSADPSGGPFLSLGFNIQSFTGRNEIIKNIYFDNGCIIETSNI